MIDVIAEWMKVLAKHKRWYDMSTAGTLRDPTIVRSCGAMMHGRTQGDLLIVLAEHDDGERSIVLARAKDGAFKRIDATQDQLRELWDVVAAKACTCDEVMGHAVSCPRAA